MSAPESPITDPSFGASPPHKASFWRRHWPKFTAGTFWLLLFAGAAYYLLSNDLTPREALRQLVGFMRDNPAAPLVYIGLYILRPLVFFPATLLSLAGGALFGAFFGVLYVIVGSNLGATLAYGLGYLFGQDALAGKGSDPSTNTMLSRFTGRLRAYSFETVLIMRFLYLPYDLVNYLSGFLRINYLAFIVATILGALPGTLWITLLGASTGLSAETEGFNPWVLVASALLFVISLAISRYVRRREQVGSGDVAAEDTAEDTAEDAEATRG
ncbi:MAG: VTT domain-containing protein [Trueperaceae bacterium]|nr:VTT domain-containing protein [Trueperaceae bacterium]